MPMHVRRNRLNWVLLLGQLHSCIALQGLSFPICNNRDRDRLPYFLDIFSPSNFIRPCIVFAPLVTMSELILALE